MKHAYLIMAHHRFDILEMILHDLDDERNDIFIHVDKKTKSFPVDELRKGVKFSHLYFTDRIKVNWGGFSQIKCELILLETALKKGSYQYFHLLCGVEVPLKSQDYIHQFFDEHKGYEFIGFDNAGMFYDRVCYWHLFNEIWRKSGLIYDVLKKISNYAILLQRKMKIDFAKKYCLDFKKGNANWSISSELAKYIIANKKLIKKIFKHSFCADELFVHTLVYNSNFKNRVYDLKDEYRSVMRLSQWENEKNQYHLADIEILTNTERLFARKIDGDDAIELINAIIKGRKFLKANNFIGKYKNNV